MKIELPILRMNLHLHEVATAIAEVATGGYYGEEVAGNTACPSILARKRCGTVHKMMLIVWLPRVNAGGPTTHTG